MLREKDILILTTIVEGYLGGGRPVSSGLVARKRRLDASPATIRNAMVRLEEEGYLSQPHTSAGRVPTDKGLKLYVNHLLSESMFGEDEGGAAGYQAQPEVDDLGGVLADASKRLAEQSDNLAFVISPQVSRIQFRHVRFVKISQRQVMVILVSTFHLVVTEIVETAGPCTQMELDGASQYINQNYRGKTLVAVRDALVQELPGFRARYEDLINRLLSLVQASIRREEEEGRIHLEGQSRLLAKVDLFDMEKLRQLFQSFEEKANLARLLSDIISLDRVKVLIGAEANVGNVSDCSLILSHYGTGGQVLGSLGVIGPKRIPYDKIIPLVDRAAKRLSRTLTAAAGEVKLS